MATRYPTTSESLSPVSNKIQDRMNVLKEVIESKKSLVRRVAKEMKTRIDNRTMDILKNLDAVWENVNTLVTRKRDEMEKTVAELNRHKAEMETLFKQHNQHPSLLTQISESIGSMRQELDLDIPFVSLTWRLSELRDCIDGMCVCETKDVKLRNNMPISLKWSSGEEGKGENQLNGPQGIAIDVMNNRVYVACHDPNKVQIFSRNGEWIESLKNDKIIDPECLLCLNNSLFIQCNKNIIHFNTSTLQLQSYGRHYGYSLSGICTDNTLIYVGQWDKMKLCVLSQELEYKNGITLNTEHKQNDTRIRDLGYARDEFYVSFSNSEYPLQAFSNEGELTRTILHRDTLPYILFFCLDQQLNIVITDRNSSNVKIVSNDGTILTQFGERGTAKGQLECLYGVAIDDCYSIITVDQKDQNCVQSFSPL